ncbi:sugar ABC transporter ATP-binding protein [Lachnospiraceae bacterium]|nr:sugar ABC transporter ATP-binding protein [Lachnospiraceae bacterium]
MRKVALRSVGLVKYAGKRRILDYCHFCVYEREILGIAGLDGSGIEALAGVLEGRVSIDDGSITMHKKELELSSKAAMMRQGVFGISRHSSLIPQLSVMENICVVKPFTWKDFLISRKKMERQVMRLFDYYGMNIPLRTPVYQLTQLERDMAEICKAALYGAKVLVLHEVSEGYTNREWNELKGLLMRICQEGASVIFIHSDLKKVLKIADRIQVIAHGFIRTEFMAEEYTDDMWKVLYQSEQFYFMHKALKKEKKKTGEGQRPMLTVEGMCMCGLKEKTVLEFPKGMAVGIVAADGKASEFAQIIGKKKKGQGKFYYAGKTFDGYSWRKSNLREIIYVSSLFWKKNCFYNLTIGENIILRDYRRLSKGLWLDKKMLRFAVKEYCRMFHLDEDIMKLKPQDVGEELLKEIFWVGLVAAHPKLLIMEEPFYALDEVGYLYMHKYVNILKEKNCSVIVCGRNQGEIEQFCDKTYILD